MTRIKRFFIKSDPKRAGMLSIFSALLTPS
jgi:hypothetical protein